MNRCSLLALIYLLHVGAHAADRLPPLQCSDFLRDMGLARPDVVFQGCATVHDRTPIPDSLQATYRVAGKDLDAVEKWAIRTFRMKRLRFTCCGWDSDSVYYTDKHRAGYEVGLGGETIVNQRKDWPSIPYLTLTVTHDLTDP